VVEGEAGDVLLYVGQLWHTVNANLYPVLEDGSFPGGKSGVRAAILGQWLPFYFSPMEDHHWRTPASVVRSMPPLSRRLLGFDGHMPGAQQRKAWRSNQRQVRAVSGLSKL